jgi:hypothetical protein
MTGCMYKFFGYVFFPLLIVGILVFGIVVKEGPEYFCTMLGFLGLLELFFLPIAIGESKKKANKEKDDGTFNQYISDMGYSEVERGLYRLTMTGRFSEQPISIRVGRSNFVLVDDGFRDGVPNRFYFFFVGRGEKYILVHDSLTHDYRLFKK